MNKDTSEALPAAVGSATLFEALIDAAVDAIVVIGDDSRIVHFNPGAERLFGYQAAEVLRQRVEMLMPQPYRDEHNQYIDRYLKTGERRIIGIGREVRGRNRAGEEFPIDLAVGETRIGALRLFVAIIRDLRQRTYLEAMLRHERQQAERIFELVDVLIVGVDRDGIVVLVNRKGGEILGADSSPVGGRWLEDWVDPKDRALAAEAIEALFAAADERRTTVVEYRIRDATGERRTIAWQQRYVAATETGEAPLTLLSGTDRTREIEAEAEAVRLGDRLAHAQRLGLMGELAAGIAHEINQPLTAIATFTDGVRRLLERRDEEDEDVMYAIGQIGDQARRAGKVITRMRALVQDKHADHVRVDLNALIEEVIPLVTLEARELGVPISLELSEELPPVRVDPIQIQQVVLNLIRNSLDALATASQAKGGIQIRTRGLADGTVETEVADRGVGIPDELKHKVFSPFFTSKPTGMGMGLSICQTIVRSHQGQLWYRERRGGGSRFGFTLPAEFDEDSED